MNQHIFRLCFVSIFYYHCMCTCVCMVCMQGHIHHGAHGKVRRKFFGVSPSTFKLISVMEQLPGLCDNFSTCLQTSSYTLLLFGVHHPFPSHSGLFPPQKCFPLFYSPPFNGFCFHSLYSLF